MADSTTYNGNTSVWKPSVSAAEFIPSSFIQPEPENTDLTNELEQLRARLAEMSNTINMHIENNVQLTLELDNSKKHVQNADNAIIVKDAKINHLKTLLSTTKEDLSIASSHLTTKDAEIKVLNEQLQQSVNTIADYSRQLNIINGELQRCNDVIKSKNNSIASLHEKYSGLKRTTDDMYKLINTYKQQLHNSGSIINKQRDELEDLKSKPVTPSIDMTETLEALEALQEEKQQLQTTVKHYKTIINTQNGHINTLTTDLADLSKKYDSQSKLNKIAGQKMIELSAAAKSRGNKDKHMCSCNLEHSERRRPFINSVIANISDELQSITFIDGTNFNDLSVVSNSYNEQKFIIVCVDIDTWHTCPDIQAWRSTAKAEDGSYNFNGLMIMPYIEMMFQNNISVNAVTEISMVWSILSDYVDTSVEYTVICSRRDMQTMRVMTEIYLDPQRPVNCIDIRYSNTVSYSQIVAQPNSWHL